MIELKETWMQADDESGDSYGYDIEADGEEIGEFIDAAEWEPES